MMSLQVVLTSGLKQGFTFYSLIITFSCKTWEACCELNGELDNTLSHPALSFVSFNNSASWIPWEAVICNNVRIKSTFFQLFITCDKKKKNNSRKYAKLHELELKWITYLSYNRTKLFSTIYAMFLALQIHIEQMHTATIRSPRMYVVVGGMSVSLYQCEGKAPSVLMLHWGRSLTQIPNINTDTHQGGSLTQILQHKMIYEIHTHANIWIFNKN